MLMCQENNDTTMNHYNSIAPTPRADGVTVEYNLKSVKTHAGMIPSIKMRRNNTKQKIANKSNLSEEGDSRQYNPQPIITGAKYVTPSDLMPAPVKIEYEKLESLENAHQSSFLSLPQAKVSKRV